MIYAHYDCDQDYDHSHIYPFIRVVYPLPSLYPWSITYDSFPKSKPKTRLKLKYPDPRRWLTTTQRHTGPVAWEPLLTASLIPVRPNLKRTRVPSSSSHMFVTLHCFWQWTFTYLFVSPYSGGLVPTKGLTSAETALRRLYCCLVSYESARRLKFSLLFFCNFMTGHVYGH